MHLINFSDTRWRTYTSEQTRTLGVYPNSLRHHADENIGALVTVKSNKYDEYAVSATGIDYLFRALEEGRIKAGYLVLMRENKIVATKDIAAVAAMVSNVAPRDGQLGPYHWFNADGTPYAAPGAAAELAPDEPLPF